MRLYKLFKKIDFLDEKIKTKFKDLFVVNSRVFKDKRGWLKEEFKKNFIKKTSFHFGIKLKKECFARSSYAKKNSQDKFLSVLKGRVLDVAVDLRKIQKHMENILRLF